MSISIAHIEHVMTSERLLHLMSISIAHIEHVLRSERLLHLLSLVLHVLNMY